MVKKSQETLPSSNSPTVKTWFACLIFFCPISSILITSESSLLYEVDWSSESVDFFYPNLKDVAKVLKMGSLPMAVGLLGEASFSTVIYYNPFPSIW